MTPPGRRAEGGPSTTTSVVLLPWEPGSPVLSVEGMETTPALEVRDLAKTYGTGVGAVRALAGVSLVLGTGTFTAVMGPSGSGKSTLLNCSAGLERPTEGRVTVGGRTLTAMTETATTRLRRERVGFVFQGFHLVPYLSAEQNVALPLRLMGRRVRARDVSEALDLVGLSDHGGRLPSELSGGQQQRVAMARAMVTDPDLLCADEPTGQLDTRSAREVLGLLRGSVDRSGQTVLMVTHDPMAASYADQVVFLVDGRVVGQMSHPTVEAVATQLANLDELVPAGGVR